MIVVKYKKNIGGHDCWGKFETVWNTEIDEFETIEDWLKFKKDSPKAIKFVCLYEVSKKIDDSYKGEV